MDAIQRGVLTLIKAAVLQQSFPLPEDFSLEQAYSLITRHHITAMAFEGARLCGIPRQDPTMGKLFAAYCRSLQISEGQLRELERVYAVFEQNHIDYMPLKGSIMKYLYPKPELRTMGDADIVIRKEQYHTITALLQENGFQWKNDSECHGVWKNNQLCLELHWKLMSHRTPTFEEYYGDGWKFAVSQQGHRYTMTEVDTFIFLFVHFTKHYLASGIGCRQTTDLWLYLSKHPGMDQAELRAKLETLKLWTFYENILDLLQYWFEGGPETEKREYMSRFILSDGSWGHMGNDRLTEAAWNMSKAGNTKRAKYLFYLQRLFPPAELISGAYPVLRKAPWLLPVFWVVRLFDKMFIKREFVRKFRQTSRQLSSDEIKQKKYELQLVGLDQYM